MDKILLLEDEYELGQNLTFILTREGYSVEHVISGDKAVSKAVNEEFDLMILDIQLKQTGGLLNDVTSGLEVARIVSQKKNTPYILLTSRAESGDVMIGLEMGAEDYITKPYNTVELLARIRRVLRRYKENIHTSAGNEVTCNGIYLNKETYKVHVNGNPVNITKNQFIVLQHLMENKNKVITRDEIYSKIWGYDPDPNLLDVTMKRIRTLIGKDKIKTVRGKGYLFEGDN